MEKIKFVMTDTDPQVSALCSHALEDKGVLGMALRAAGANKQKLDAAIDKVRGGESVQ